MKDFVRELAKFVSEEGYYRDIESDECLCLECDSGAEYRNDVKHKEDCMVGRAEKYLKSNPEW